MFDFPTEKPVTARPPPFCSGSERRHGLYWRMTSDGELELFGEKPKAADGCLVRGMQECFFGAYLEVRKIVMRQPGRQFSICVDPTIASRLWSDRQLRIQHLLSARESEGRIEILDFAFPCANTSFVDIPLTIISEFHRPQFGFLVE